MINLTQLPRPLVKLLRNSVLKFNLYYFKLTGKTPYPKAAIIDPVNTCILRCPLCPTGAGKIKCRRTQMSFALFKKILKQIPTLRHISLFNWGESLLNPQIFKMIRYARQRNILVSLHTNLNLEKDREFWQELLLAGVSNLEISLDGASQETYEKYRRQGNFALALKNLTTLAELKKELGLARPNLVWKFIVNRYNEKEIEQARSMAADLGVDFALETLEVGDLNPDIQFDGSYEQRLKTWLPRQQKYQFPHYQHPHQHPIFNQPCDQLFTVPVIGPDGKVFPCCFLADEKNAFGDLSRKPFAKIWNNARYVHSRSLFVKNKRKAKIETICDHCHNFKQVK